MARRGRAQAAGRRDAGGDATPAEQDAAVAAASDALDALNVLLDGVVREYCAEVAA
jgi:hypothetical protein